MVYILLGTGFEEIEAIAPCDILRRSGIETRLVWLEDQYVTGGHGITVKADCHLSEIDWDKIEMMVIPGGLGGVEAIENSAEAIDAIIKADQNGAYLAAICAGPRVLAKLGLLNGKQIVCFPGMEAEMTGATVVSQKTNLDGKLLSGQAAGAAIDFALALIAALKGKEMAETIKNSIYYDA